METQLAQKKGKYVLRKVELDTVKIIANALDKHTSILKFLSTLNKPEHHKDFSICAVMHYQLTQRLSKRGLPQLFEISYEFYQLFVLYEALQTAAHTENDYERSIISQLTMMIFAHLPQKSNHNVFKYDSLNRLEQKLTFTIEAVKELAEQTTDAKTRDLLISLNEQLKKE